MKKNLILLAVCALIAAFYYLDQFRMEKQKQKEEKEKELITLKTDEVKEVAIVKKDERFKAVKDKDTWKMVEPFETGADKSTWDSVVSGFTGGKKERVVFANAQDLKPFGLNEPVFQVTLSGIGGATATTILLGKQTPTSGKYYALIKGTSDVVTVMSNMYSNVDKRLYDLRDKTILSIENDKVQKVEIVHPQLSTLVQRKGEDRWVINQPISARADGTKMQDLLNKIKNGRIKQFIDEDPKTLEAYGLVKPATKLVVWSGDPVNESSWAASTLLLGSSSTTDFWYAKREGQNSVFSVDPKDFTEIPITLDKLRSKKLTAFRSWELNQIKIASAGAMIFEASKNAGEWNLLQPKTIQLDYNSISELTRNISDLEPAEFVQGTTDQYGLGSPSVTIELHTEKGVESVALAGPKAASSPQSATEIVHYYYGARTEPLEIFSLKEESVQKILVEAIKIRHDAEAKAAPTPVAGATSTMETSPIPGVLSPKSATP